MPDKGWSCLVSGEKAHSARGKDAGRAWGNVPPLKVHRKSLLHGDAFVCERMKVSYL